MITTQLRVPTAEFEAATGWQLKPEGACKGEMCVPLPADAVDASEGMVAVEAVAERLGMPVVHDVARGLYAVGPESIGGHALATAVAPELVLPDLDGNEFRLSSLQGQKVLLVAWAPY
jgi:hypothetical protein